MSENTNQEQVVAQPVQVALAMPVKTSHVAAALGILPIQLRRHLRTMEGGYNDGVHTNYGWESMECAEVVRIMTYVRNRMAARRAPVAPVTAQPEPVAPETVAPVAPEPVQDAPVATGRRVRS